MNSALRVASWSRRRSSCASASTTSCHIEAALSRAEEIQARFSGIGEEVARDLATAAL
jgi:hypothetical protein